MTGRSTWRLAQRFGLGLLLPLAALAAGSADEPEQTPFTVTLEKQITDDRVHYHLRVHADPSQVDSARTTVVAHSRSSAGFSSVRTLTPNADDQWHWQITPDEPARYRIDLETSGRSPEGEPLRMALGSQYFQFPEPGDPYISPEERELEALARGLDDDLEPAPLPELTPRMDSDEPPPATAEAAKISPSHNATDAVSRVMRYGSILTGCLVALALVAFGAQTIVNRRRAERAKAQREAAEQEQGDAPSPSMQDIGSEDDELDTDSAGPAADTPTEPSAILGAEEVDLPPEVVPSNIEADEPLFPLDDDDWASAETENDTLENAPGSPPASSKPPPPVDDETGDQ